MIKTTSYQTVSILLFKFAYQGLKFFWQIRQGLFLNGCRNAIQRLSDASRDAGYSVRIASYGNSITDGVFKIFGIQRAYNSLRYTFLAYSAIAFPVNALP